MTQPAPEGAEQGGLAGLLARVTAHGQVAHGAGDQRDEGDQAGDREAEAGLLGRVLGEDLLVLRGVGHRDGGAVDELDAPPVEEPVALAGDGLQGIAGVPRQARQNAQREPPSGLAVGPGLGRAGGLAARHEQGDEATYSGTTGVVRAHHLPQ